MSSLDLWTRVAIAVLIGGSLLVFVWFVRDLFRLGRRRPEPPSPEP